MGRTRAARGVGWLVGWALVGLALSPPPPAPGQEPPGDATWTADAAADVARAITDPGLGAVQGVVVRDGRVYAYGDLVRDRPRVGVIREYSMALEPTGRAVRLTRGGAPLLTHPTGLTWHDRWGTWIGDTVKTADPNRSRAVLYRLDWERAWADGHLDSALLATIDDDAAVNGCRPEFVAVAGRTLLATADYGAVRPEVRLYDPAALVAAGRSSAPGVVAHRFLCGPFNQNLHWDAATGRLTLIQNVVAGRGWRLDEVDLARALLDGRADGPGVRARCRTFPAHDELEGFWPLGGDRALFAIARRGDNLFEAAIRPTPPVESPPPAPEPEVESAPAPAPAAAPSRR